MADEVQSSNLRELTGDIVAAYVSKNPVASSDLPGLIASVHQALTSVANGPAAAPAEPLKPAVPVKKSVQDDHIVCLEDGKKFKSLKRHMMTHHGMTPDEYRAKWNLSKDYPMVAPAYAAARSSLAKASGLGRKAAVAKPAAAKRGRAKKPKA